MLYVLSNDLATKVRVKSEQQQQLDDKFENAYRDLVAGLRESKINSIQYPMPILLRDCLTEKVNALPKDPRNDAAVNNYTTMTGLVKKYKAGDEEFDLPSPIIRVE